MAVSAHRPRPGRGTGEALPECPGSGITSLRHRSARLRSMSRLRGCGQQAAVECIHERGLLRELVGNATVTAQRTTPPASRWRWNCITTRPHPRHPRNPRSEVTTTTIHPRCPGFPGCSLCARPLSPAAVARSRSVFLDPPSDRPNIGTARSRFRTPWPVLRGDEQRMNC